MFQSFVGKTIQSVDDSSQNYVKFFFTDDSTQGVYAECGSSNNSIPFFDFSESSENQSNLETETTNSMFQSFVGKTIQSVDDSSQNYVKFLFTDGSSQGVFSECGSSNNSIPFFDFAEPN